MRLQRLKKKLLTLRRRVLYGFFSTGDGFLTWDLVFQPLTAVSSAILRPASVEHSHQSQDDQFAFVN